jgi:hypothetical protein
MSSKRRFTLTAALVALAATATALGFHLIERDAERSFVDDLVFVPLVVGKDERKAIEAVERVGLRPEVTYSRFRAKHPSLGQVVMQASEVRASPRGEIQSGWSWRSRSVNRGRSTHRSPTGRATGRTDVFLSRCLTQSPDFGASRR